VTRFLNSASPRHSDRMRKGRRSLSGCWGRNGRAARGGSQRRAKQKKRERKGGRERQEEMQRNGNRKKIREGRRGRARSMPSRCPKGYRRALLYFSWALPCALPLPFNDEADSGDPRSLIPSETAATHVMRAGPFWGFLFPPFSGQDDR